MIATEGSRSIEFTTGVYLEVGGRQLHSEPRLIMLPEFATGSTLRSVLVVIRERALDAIRVGLREAALAIAATEPSPEPGSVAPSAWQHRARGVLDLLREVLPHDLAIIQEVSSHGDWVRPILMHPEPQQRWPRMWWRVAESERGLLDAPAPFAIRACGLVAKQSGSARRANVEAVVRGSAERQTDGLLCSHADSPVWRTGIRVGTGFGRARTLPVLR